MAMMKPVEISATLGPGMKTESRVRGHVVLIDQPKELGGTDTGPTPLEYLFCSLAGCITTIGRIVAHQQKIALRGMEVRVSGALDVNTLLGKSQETRAGFTGITVQVRLDADLTAEQKRAFLRQVDERCPVSDNVRQLTPLTTELVE
ncbi:MAG: OsmC family protein [Candidatus Latescibacterota bacterium]